MCYYEKIVDEKDLGPLLKAQEKFSFIVKEYPNSDYALDAEYKLDLIQDYLASKEMYIASHYMKKKKWIASINRYKTVIEQYENTIYVEEALHRLVELYFNIGLKKESQKYASLLGYNYQSSKWYEKSYKIFNQDYKTVLQIKKKKSLLKKFKNFSSKMVKSLKAKQEYKNKIRLYKKYSQKYFEDSVPIISDYEFDLLKKEIISLEKKFNFDDPESPSRTLGFKPSKNFEKFPHRVKMLSLANAFDERDLINFEKR